MKCTVWALVNKCTVTISVLFVAACGENRDWEFERRTRETIPEVSYLSGVLEAKAFLCKRNRITFDAVIELENVLTNHYRFKIDSGDCYYVSTNTAYWTGDTLTSNPAIAKRIISSRGNDGNRRYVIRSHNSNIKLYCATNFCAIGLVPITVNPPQLVGKDEKEGR